MQRKAFDLAAQLAWHEERALSTIAPADAQGGGAAFVTECHATLDRGCAELCEQRLFGLGLKTIVVLIAGDPAEPAQVAQDTAMKNGGDQDDILVGERRSFMEDRWRERALARVHAVDHERVEVEAQVECATEALGEDDGSRSSFLEDSRRAFSAPG